jgi:ubiquinone/menaquinone biosynthesis C-methylase UbiE
MSDTDRWIKKYGEIFLRQAGIKKGDIIFDCCCGEGNYTIPAAKISGRNGTVYAMDMDKDKLDRLREKLYSENLKNISVIELEFDRSLPLTDRSVDIVLLYDIFWYFSNYDEKLKLLLEESYRILKDCGSVSVYPEHTDPDRLKQVILNSGFKLDREFSAIIIHEHRLQKKYVWNFRKILK